MQQTSYVYLAYGITFILLGLFTLGLSLKNQILKRKISRYELSFKEQSKE